MIKRFLIYPFLIASGVGLAVSIAAHFAALAGYSIIPGKKVFLLHIGIFAVWVPTIIVWNMMAREVKQKDMWKAVLRGCPQWMRYAGYVLFGYAILNFILFMVISPPPKQIDKQNEEWAVPAGVRGFSGHWMMFYGMSFAVFYSALRVDELDRRRRCANGHKVSPLAKYCEECGAPVIIFDSESNIPTQVKDA
jgi:hypothetical protein